MQSNENPEVKDLLKMDDARATITGPQSIEMEDNSTATTITAAVAEDVADEESTTTAKPTLGTKLSIDCDGDMMPPPPLVMEPRPPSSAASDRDDDESLSLQELSGRSSTPYTVQSVCCDNANCELGSTSSTTVSPVKEESPEDGLGMDRHKDDLGTEVGRRAQDEIEGRKYTRSDLMNIRDCMTIVRPECLGALRLKRLHFLKSENVASNLGTITVSNKNKSYRTSNPQNDLMPAFFKRKTALSNGSTNSITYDTFKYTDSHTSGNRSESAPPNIHRRIGSGRISNREVNWDYIPEEDPENSNLPEFFTTKDTTTSNTKVQQQRHTKKYDLDDNSNYVKRVINSVVGESSSSFRSVISKTSNNSVGDDRHSTSNGVTNGGTNNKSDEPEWFSCGPTSRLDTIELCGFNESDQQEIRMEMAKVKNKPDLNNNSEDPKANGGHKEKKHLAFQFDDFSSHGGKSAGNSNSASSSRMPGSKFLPLFNAKKREDEKPTKDMNASQLLNDFFKRSDLPTALKEKMSMSEIPSVDEIEARYRNPQQQQKDSKPTNAEQFKKMLSQLRQNQAGGGVNLPTTSQQPAPPPPQSQPGINLFNNDNLSNFIKQRNLQQQLLQKQQQAAFAQFQLNSILNRPEAQMLLLSLARGEISKQGLIVQLSNPNLTQADRETITAVLTFSAAGQYQQQLAINTTQHQQFITNQLQHLALLQQQISKNTAAKRNLGANGFQPTTVGGSNPRTYSQEELQSHANLILHNAMMKKRIEEQTSLGVQKILQMQNSMLNNGYNSGNPRTNDTLAGSKNQAQQQQLNRNRKGSSNAGNRGNNLGRRRSTSSTSSSNAGINTTHMKLASDLEYRQLEQRRNTIATTNATVMRIRRPRNITRTQFMIVSAVGFLGGVYIWQPLLLKWKRETESAATADQPKLETATAAK